MSASQLLLDRGHDAVAGALHHGEHRREAVVAAVVRVGDLVVAVTPRRVELAEHPQPRGIVQVVAVRQHVAVGTLPPGAELGGKRLWRVADVDEALAKLLPSAKDDGLPGADPVLERIGRAGNGQATKGGRHAA